MTYILTYAKLAHRLYDMGLTKKQKEVFDYIKTYTSEYGYSPTQKEIKEHFGLKSFGSVQRYLKYLKEAELLASDWNARRGIQINDPQIEEHSQSLDPHSLELPLLGLVAAGNPIEAIENPTETTVVPKHFVKPQHRHFALTVQGDSMIEDGILEDDIVVIRESSTAKVGQTVVAVIDGEATLKKYYPKQNSIELHPANSRLSPIIVTEGNLRLVGTLVGLIRHYP